jgi:hypothetical protein
MLYTDKLTRPVRKLVSQSVQSFENQLWYLRENVEIRLEMVSDSLAPKIYTPLLWLNSGISALN